MSRISKFRPRHGTVVGYLALFVALGGTSYAVTSGSIDSREIKNNSVRGKDIRNGSVGSKDVGNSSLLAKDFKPGQLPAGPAGPRGSQGPAGKDGADGTGGGGAGTLTVRSNSGPITIPCVEDSEGTTVCNRSERVTARCDLARKVSAQPAADTMAMSLTKPVPPLSI